MVLGRAVVTGSEEKAEPQSRAEHPAILILDQRTLCHLPQALGKASSQAESVVLPPPSTTLRFSQLCPQSPIHLGPLICSEATLPKEPRLPGGGRTGVGEPG